MSTLSARDSPFNKTLFVGDTTMPTMRAVTFNPVIDVIYQLKAYEKGGTTRSEAFKKIPAGKGFSVAYALAHLGELSHVYAPLGEQDLPLYRQQCRELGIHLHTAVAPFDVRQHCTIIESSPPQVTHLQSTNHQIPLNCLQEVQHRLYEHLEEGDWVVLSGSLPGSAPTNLYAQVIAECRSRGTLTVLDSSGEALIHGAQAQPYALKLNQNEAETLASCPIAGRQQALKVLQVAQRHSKASLVVISLGSEGLLASSAEGVWRMRVPIEPRRVVDTVGCGDSLVAGLVYGLKQNWPHEPALRFAIAVAAAATRQIGPGYLKKEEALNLQPYVEVEKINDSIIQQ